MPPRPGTSTESQFGLPHAVALAVHTSRNLVVQVTGVAMVVLVGLVVVPWPQVVAWAAVTVVVVALEHRLLRLVAGGGRHARRAAAGATVLRVLATTLYALAALLLVINLIQAWSRRRMTK